jgi:hypothetical protein
LIAEVRRSAIILCKPGKGDRERLVPLPDAFGQVFGF